VTTLHTVLTSPTPNQHRVLAGIVEASAALVTMTETARDRLIAGWGVDPAMVTVIAHGAVDNRAAAHAPSVGPTSRRAGRMTVLTWGLLSEGKGIEWALHGLAELRDRIAAGAPGALPLYRIVGQTHPRVLEREGEAYRDSLIALTAELGLTDDVEFDSRYLAGPDLLRVVRDADLILLPYDSRDQVTSGVLTEAVAAGKPVISTTFPHAVELLSGGAGLLVPQGDHRAIADALERVLTVGGLADGMAATSHLLAETLLWPAVAGRYAELATSLLAVPVRAAV
jgi:glycosyltransferase involved in cell wall biosynthesis